MQTIAAGIVIGVILHAGNHLACDFPRLIHESDARYKLYLINDFGHHKPKYMDLVKGIEGVTGILMIIFMLVAFTLATRQFRRSLITLPKPFNRLTGYNAFWYSHHLFVLVYILLIIHGVFLYLVHKWYKKTVCIENCLFLLNYCLNHLITDNFSLVADVDVPCFSCTPICRGKDPQIFPVRLVHSPAAEGEHGILLILVRRNQGFIQKFLQNPEDCLTLDCC